MNTRLHIFFMITVMFLSMNGLLLTGSYAEEGPAKPVLLNATVVNQMNTLLLEKNSRTEAQKKMSSQFIYALKIKRGDPLMDNLPNLKAAVEIDPDDTTLVDIKARVTVPLLKEIERIGGVVINIFEQYDSIMARLSLEEIESLAANPDILFIRPARKPVFNKTNTSEGDAAHNAATARTTFSVNGTGVKVGVLSDSVDYLAAAQSSGDLPAVTVLQNAPGNTGEGTAMLEIIYDLAPGAQLYFATALGGAANFANNILALEAAGCQVIADDALYLTESPFQDDIISQAVNTVTSNGVLYFSSAGNSGNLNDGQSGVWEGDYNGTAHSYGFLGYPTIHDFGGGDTINQITAANSVSNEYTLFWSDELGSSSNDYDLYILLPNANSIFQASTDDQDGFADPYEQIVTSTDITDYQVVIAKELGSEDRFIYFSSNRGRLEHGTDGQIRGHCAAANGFAVAAADASGMTTPFNGTESVETFSSDGPRRIFYLADGTPITPGNFSSTGGSVRRKPDITAADGVKTTITDFNPFNSTSASAAHAAAIAALMLSAKPDLTIARVRSTFRATALDIEAPGWDRDSGYGIIMADKALGFSPFNPGIQLLLLE